MVKYVNAEMGSFLAYRDRALKEHEEFKEKLEHFAHVSKALISCLQKLSMAENDIAKLTDDL